MLRQFNVKYDFTKKKNKQTVNLAFCVTMSWKFSLVGVQLDGNDFVIVNRLEIVTLGRSVSQRLQWMDRGRNEIITHVYDYNAFNVGHTVNETTKK